jgi:hypothetical protein
MKLRYDGVGYAHCNGHWIRKPLVRDDQNFGVYSGSHPHDPDGDDSYYVGSFTTEAAAIAKTVDLYRKFLLKELDRLA